MISDNTKEQISLKKLYVLQYYKQPYFLAGHIRDAITDNIKIIATNESAIEIGIE